MWRRRTKPRVKADAYAKLGKEVESVLVEDYLEQKPARQLFFSFIKGAAGGLGGVIGATLMVGLLLLLLQHLGALPWIGQFFKTLSNALHQTPTK